MLIKSIQLVLLLSLLSVDGQAAQFKSVRFTVNSYIDESHMEPARLSVTGIGGGNVGIGLLKANSETGAVVTTFPVVLESWDLDSNVLIDATWRLSSFSVSAGEGGSVRELLDTDFDIYFNNIAMTQGVSSLTDVSQVTVSIKSNKAQILVPGEPLISLLNITTEVDF